MPDIAATDPLALKGIQPGEANPYKKQASELINTDRPLPPVVTPPSTVGPTTDGIHGASVDPAIVRRVPRYGDADLTAAILTERAKTHGDFTKQSRLAQGLKEMLRTSHGHHALPLEVKEALDMICVKMSRLVCGNYAHIDSWDDIGGYARCGRNAVQPNA